VQFTQELSSEAPSDVRYLPALQSLQALATVAPVVVRYLPAPHSAHEVEPGILLYFPATQAVHGPPSDPENPELQRQLVETLLPLRDCEFTVQFPQLEDAVAPTVVE